MKNLLVAQSGGPTAAINATLAGVLLGARESEKIDTVYGAIGGVQGILNGHLLDLNKRVPDASLQLLAQTPASALGSCRLKLDEPEESGRQFAQIVQQMRKLDIRHFVYIGGNDSMDTVSKLARYLRVNGISDITAVGAPKTIDNDLVLTDHCPGFGSAAKYIATTVAELERDCSVYQMPSVTIVEIMGRDAGWLTAASALSRLAGGPGPALIYCCERPLSTDTFLAQLQPLLRENRGLLVAVSEGVRTPGGAYLSEAVQPSETDPFGHRQNAGAARVLEQLVRRELGCKVRSVELNLMQRAAAHIASQTDLNEAVRTGRHAVDASLEGQSGVMVCIRRISGTPYQIQLGIVPVEQVANRVSRLPDTMITPDGKDVTPDAMEYLTPLIQGEAETLYENGIPQHIRLF